MMAITTAATMMTVHMTNLAMHPEQHPEKKAVSTSNRSARWHSCAVLSWPESTVSYRLGNRLDEVATVYLPGPKPNVMV